MKTPATKHHLLNPNLHHAPPDLIRGARIARNHTQREAARLVGVTTGHWGAWEQGIKKMTFSILMTYCGIEADDKGVVKSRVFSFDEREAFSDAGVYASPAERKKLAKKIKKK